MSTEKNSISIELFCCTLPHINWWVKLPRLHELVGNVRSTQLQQQLIDMAEKEIFHIEYPLAYDF